MISKYICSVFSFITALHVFSKITVSAYQQPIAIRQTDISRLAYGIRHPYSSRQHHGNHKGYINREPYSIREPYGIREPHSVPKLQGNRERAAGIAHRGNYHKHWLQEYVQDDKYTGFNEEYQAVDVYPDGLFVYSNIPWRILSRASETAIKIWNNFTATGTLTLQPRCPFSLFKSTTRYSLHFDLCYWTAENLFCSDTLGTLSEEHQKISSVILYRNCFKYINLASIQYNILWQLIPDEMKYQPKNDCSSEIECQQLASRKKHEEFLSCKRLNFQLEKLLVQLSIAIVSAKKEVGECKFELSNIVFSNSNENTENEGEYKGDDDPTCMAQCCQAKCKIVKGGVYCSG